MRSVQLCVNNPRRDAHSAEEGEGLGTRLLVWSLTVALDLISAVQHKHIHVHHYGPVAVHGPCACSTY